ncbi:PLD-like domain family protein [Aspergillus niger]|uniref:PLD-like domain family protein n=1 Tax=Aspergillus niger TaxID=5061 RepID=A0A505ICK3_ASPNG|nr:PLD-like domain family protein [Aspergillus niger]
MAASQPPFSYRRLIHDNQAQFESLVQNGDVKPVLLWHLMLPLVLSILALLVPQQRGGRYVRPLVLACVIGITSNVLQHRRMLTGGNGYMGGLIPVWSTIWSATILLFRDVERDFKRIERHPLSSTMTISNGDAALNGHAKESKCMVTTHNSSAEPVSWQPYPQTLSRRLNWVISVATSMRGPEWNWRISTMGALPASVQAQLNNSSEHHSEEEKATTTTNTNPEPITMRTRLRATLTLFIQSYLLLDLIKLLMIRDQYFMGS